MPAKKETQTRAIGLILSRAGLSKLDGLCYNITLSSCLPDRAFALKNTNLALHFVPS